MTQDTPSPRPDRLSGRDLAQRAMTQPAMDDVTRGVLWRIVHRLEADVAQLRTTLERFEQ